MPIPGAGEAPAGREPGASGRLFSLPLVRVAEATRAEVKVRVWGELPTRAVPADASWDELATETVAGRDSLPLLVLRSGRAENPLNLRLVDATETQAAPGLIERALVLASHEGFAIYFGHIGSGNMPIGCRSGSRIPVGAVDDLDDLFAFSER